MGKWKAHVVLLFAAIMLLAMAVPAFAEVGPPRPQSYIDWSTVEGQGSSPHGGYSTTTTKCAVCHAVHGAEVTGSKLLRGSGTCDYCHVDTFGAGYTQVYGGIWENHEGTDSPNAHNKWYDADTDQWAGVGCTDCHQVHGAEKYMSGHEYLDRKILVVSVDDQFDPYWDLELGAPDPSTDSSDTALAKYCAACHANIGGPSGYSYTGSTSHVMSDTFTEGAGQVAWEGTQYCSSCHASGYQTSAWPHMTQGTRFLLSGENAQSVGDMTDLSSSDGACLRCHAGDAETGVGVSF